MKRHLSSELLKWKHRSNRRPLILQGARQVGKTYLLNDFGREHYQNVAYFNFESQSSLVDIFKFDFNPERIIKALSFSSRVSIVPESTLIIFDEVQACEEALTSLKYFAEDAPSYHIIASGSLLGIAVNRKKFAFPVGKEDLMTLYPLSFEEFLWAMQEFELIERIQASYKTMSEMAVPYHQIAIEKLLEYWVIGGMPAVVKTYLETQDMNLVRNEQNVILNTYLMDMSKYSSPSEVRKTKMIYQQISSQLTKANKKFKYSSLKTGGRQREFEGSIEWLTSTGIMSQVFRVDQIKHPLSIYQDVESFKAFASDTGLLCAIAQVHPELILFQDQSISDFKGGLVENYVANQFTNMAINHFYWTSEGRAEVDFIIEYKNRIIPVEVKSSENVRSRSLSIYKERFEPNQMIRLSLRNFGLEGNLKSIPLYAVFCLKKSD